MSFSVEQIRPLFDFQSHFLDLDGIRCHYVDEGSGDPVVMVHGNPSWSFMYRHLITGLRADHRVIAPDHIGCGFSEKPDDSRYSYTLSRRVDDFEKLLDRVGVTQDITLVAHDWGGVIAMTYATRHPERVRRIVLFNTAAFLLPSWKSLHWTLRLCRDSRLFAFLIRRFNLFSWGASWLGCRKRPMSRPVRRAYTAPYDSWGNRIATLRFVQDIPLTAEDPAYTVILQTQESLQRLQEVPMMICWGEKDFVFDGDFLNEWQRRFPNAEIHRFNAAGHYVLEDESEAILPLVRDFIAKHPLTPRAA